MQINPFQHISNALKGQANNASTTAQATASSSNTNTAPVQSLPEPPVISAQQLIAELKPLKVNVVQGVLVSQGKIDTHTLPTSLLQKHLSAQQAKLSQHGSASNNANSAHTQVKPETTWLKVAISQQASVLLLLFNATASNRSQPKVGGLLNLHIAQEGSITLAKPPPKTQGQPSSHSSTQLSNSTTPHQSTQQRALQQFNTLPKYTNQIPRLNSSSLGASAQTINTAAHREPNIGNSKAATAIQHTLGTQQPPPTAKPIIQVHSGTQQATEQLLNALSKLSGRHGHSSLPQTSQTPQGIASQQASLSAPSHQLLNQFTQLKHALSNSPQVIKTQLLPASFQQSLEASLIQPQSPEKTAARLQEHIRSTPQTSLISQWQPAHNAAQKLANTGPLPLLAALLKNLPNAQSSQAEIQEKRGAIARWLQVETAAQLARAATQIGSNLAQFIEHPESANLSQEFAIKWGNEYGLMQLKIEEKYDESTHNQDAEYKDSQQSQWQVYLSLELPKEQSLDSEITLSGSNITVELWTQSTGMHQAVNSQAGSLKQQFEQDELELAHFHCHLGHPSVAKPALRHSLIDITT